MWGFISFTSSPLSLLTRKIFHNKLKIENILEPKGHRRNSHFPRTSPEWVTIGFPVSKGHDSDDKVFFLMRTMADVSPHWQLFWEHDLAQVGNEGLVLCSADLLTLSSGHSGDAKNLHQLDIYLGILSLLALKTIFSRYQSKKIPYLCKNIIAKYNYIK